MSVIPKQIKQDLEAIKVVADDLKMKIYVVGGFARDLVSGIGVDDETDLDLTEENGNAFDLAYFVAAKYGLMEPEVYESSGTAMVTMPSGRVVEFHNSYVNVPHIIDQLYVLNVEPTSLNKDVYSRDFTINTLLFDPETEEILDLTGMGKDDIKNKILRTPLSPEKTLGINPKIILRGLRFKYQFSLKEDPEYTKTVPKFVPWLIQFLQDNPQSKMVQRTVKKTLDYNRDAAIQEYKNLGIYQYLPETMIDMEKDIKKDLFGTTISPTSFEFASSFVKKVQAQTGMINHLMDEREKHKAYIERKKRETKQRREREMDIMDRANSGFYRENPDPEQPEQKKKKDMGRPGYEFIPKKRR